MIDFQRPLRFPQKRNVMAKVIPTALSQTKFHLKDMLFNQIMYLVDPPPHS